jgi:hypothetical protein
MKKRVATMNKLFIPALGASLLCFAAANYYFWLGTVLNGQAPIESWLNTVIAVLLALAAIAAFISVGIGRILAIKYNFALYFIIAVFYLILSALGATAFFYDVSWIDSESVKKAFTVSLVALIALEFVVFKGVRNG